MLGRTPRIEDLKSVKEDYRKILLSTMKLIADRYENNPDYSWIDTKLNINTGEDFPQWDPLGNKNIIYPWIQGRGLESLTLHRNWMQKEYSDKTVLVLAHRLEDIVIEVAESIEQAKKLNRGHLFFFMNDLGESLNMGNDGSWVQEQIKPEVPWNTSDMFVSRGLFAASLISGYEEDRVSSIEYVINVLNGIKHGNFVTDQQPLAEGNPVTAIDGRLSQSPWMLLIGSMTLLLKHGVPEALDSGIYAIRYILENHVNINRKWKKLNEFDFVEYIRTDGDLWYNKDKVLSDPGHALEFVGLALQFCFLAESLVQADTKLILEIKEITSFMFPIFQRNFVNGYNRRAKGIIKLFDLISRKPVNSQMPWWPLPETMRAALGCYKIVKDKADRSFCMKAYSICHNSLLKNYIKEDSPGLLAVQTRDKKGRIIDYIPAVPDADPGYHTGLALIDCLEMIDEQ